MKALLVKLSAIDSDTEAALRVISYFDALAMRSATAEMVVRGAAAISEATAGLQLADGSVLRFDASGRKLPGRTKAVRAPVHQLGDLSAWIEREGTPRPLDELVVERFALASKTAARERTRPNLGQWADPGALELILSAREPVAERSVALRRLGFSPSGHIAILAVAGMGQASPSRECMDAVQRRVSARHRSRSARLGDLGTVLVQLRPDAELDAEISVIRLALDEEQDSGDVQFRCGISIPVEALNASGGWASARSALRFARAQAHGSAVVDASQLGAISALASISPDTWAADWRVRSLRELEESDSGRVDLEVLEAYLAHGSLRMAGQSLHMHHSSVASRLARLEERLNMNFTSPSDLFQVRLCLYAATLVGSMKVAQVEEDPVPLPSVLGAT